MGNNVTNLASVCRPRPPGKELSGPLHQVKSSGAMEKSLHIRRILAE